MFRHAGAHASMVAPVAALMAIAACTSPPPAADLTRNAPAGSSASATAEQPENTSAREPAERPVTDGSAETVERGTGEQADQPFVASPELYEKTFDEVNDLITHLNQVIRRRDFATWQQYLTEEYIAQSSAREYLQALEQHGPLLRNNIQLEDLEDFFTHIVVPSRSNAVLDSVDFVDADHVKAVSMTSRGPGVLYFLVRSDDSWKIGVF